MRILSILALIAAIAIFAYLFQNDKPEVNIQQNLPKIIKPVKVTVPVGPAPYTILKVEDTEYISDEKLRDFVKTKTNFTQEKVLYFVWTGGEKDSMVSIPLSDFETKQKRYSIVLKPVRGPQHSHQQVFIVPIDCVYDTQID
jgi:hypothetical protein